MSSVDPLLLKSPVSLRKEHFLGSVLVFEQRTKQKQLDALYFDFELIPCILPFFEDIQIVVSDSILDISNNTEPKGNMYVSKSLFGQLQPETDQILKTEDLAIVSWLTKHFAFFTHLV